MNLATRIRFGLARLLLKANTLTFISPWVKTTFLVPTFERLTSEAYQKNSIVTACISVLTFAFPEPPLMVYTKEGADGEALPDHPLRKLLRKPNPIMGEDELWQYTMAYTAIGGNAYWLCGLNGAGQPVEIWPYHMGQVRPVPGGPQWIRGYEFKDETGNWVPINPDEYLAVHFKWPLPDLTQPWIAQAPLRAVAAAVDVDSELDRYLYALLKNDAIPRTIIKFPKDSLMDPQSKAIMRAQWRERYSGDNLGDIAILDDGAEVQRLSLDLEELAFGALRKVPETRIAAAFRVPPILAGLLVGLEHATYSNYKEARKAFTEDCLVPLWRAWGAEVQSALGMAWGKAVSVHHDLSEVASLQEDINARWARVDKAFLSGYLGFFESRRALGYGDPDAREWFWASTTGALTMGIRMLAQATDQPDAASKATPILGYHIESGVVSRNEARAQLGLPPEDQATDDTLRRLQSLLAVALAAVNVGIDTPEALTLVGLNPALAGSGPPVDLPPPKASPALRATKASPARIARTLQRLRAAAAGRMETAIEKDFAALAAHVVARANALKSYGITYANGNGHGTIETKELPGLDELIEADDWIDLDRTVHRFYVEIMSASWETWNTAIGSEVAFELTDPAVVATMKNAAQRVKGINDTTRQAIRDVLSYGAEQGWTLGQLVAGDDTQPGLRATVQETYKGRAKAVARSEMANAQQVAAVERFSAAGLTHVIVFDGGGDDSDDACNQLNGTRQTLAWARANPTGHTNCVRCFAPALDDE